MFNVLRLDSDELQCLWDRPQDVPTPLATTFGIEARVYQYGLVLPCRIDDAPHEKVQRTRAVVVVGPCNEVLEPRPVDKSVAKRVDFIGGELRSRRGSGS